MKVINEAKQGKCEICGTKALLDKGYGTKWACEKCFYEIGNHTKFFGGIKWQQDIKLLEKE